jgi:hypothetical protein
MLLPPPLPPPTASVSDGASCSDDTALNARSFDRVLLSAGTQLPFGLGARYEAEVLRRDPSRCDVLRMNAQALTLSYTPACNCFQIDAQARLLPPPTNFDFKLLVTIARLGTIGI